MPEASPDELSSFPEPQADSGSRAATATAVARVLRDMRTAGGSFGRRATATMPATGSGADIASFGGKMSMDSAENFPASIEAAGQGGLTRAGQVPDTALARIANAL
ncbi:hypothetical protein GCM10010345_67320 [Streptomyces canarius]|uniref:Uncharacterized protein n=1 Tax=Streptomyces canarius TaxID=285453 RepID=A0ABQ3D2W5_9ACTN|nr:hypothetical protein GCM10010345_67320 [Streptomyces canarius]